MKTRSIFSFFIVLVFCIPSFAQTYSVTGRIVDATDTTTLIGVSCSFTGITDTTIKTGSVTDADGNFQISNIAPGSYKLKFDYVGYAQVVRTVAVTGDNVALGTIKMTSTTKELKSVTVSALEVRAKQLGDTSQFNASAYKTHPDASAEDLVSKMPGVTSDNSGVKVNGETVQQVLVDGKPFFGTDPTLALRNLPAEVIDNIQIFDRMSDQASFTGFDDGTSQKSMNINTKKNKQEGVFGKVYAGYGTDDRYIAGGNLNIFHHDTRISLLGLFNNINQQNFSSQDLLGITSGSGGGGGRGGFGGNRGGGGGGGGFFTGQQNGIATTSSVGLNYSDKWGKKIKVSGSYFFNGTNTDNASDVTRQYTTPDSTLYTEKSTSNVQNTNHRFNFRLEYAIDSENTIIFTPALSFQHNNTATVANENTSIHSLLSSLINNKTTAINDGYNSSGNLLWQHKFAKMRRTISVNFNANLNEKGGDGTYYSANHYMYPFDTSSLFDQHYNLYNNSNTVGVNVTYTEPIGKKGQLLATYNPSVSKSKADKETYDKDATDDGYNLFNSSLSNKYDNTYTIQKGDLSYRSGDRKFNYSVGANVQYAELAGIQHFPTEFELNKNFLSVLPNALINRTFNDGRNLRLMYRTNTDAPSVSQLQSVLDISNPLQLKTGNPDLKQDFEQTFIVRYGQAKSKKEHNFFSNLYVNLIHNYIGNANYLYGNKDTTIRDTFTHTSIHLNANSQLSRPVNLDGYVSMRSFVTYGMPVKFIKSNLNFTGSFNYTRTPGLINNVLNYSNNYIPSAGVVLGSNISEQLDFTVSYTGNYNIIKYTTQLASNSNYYNAVTAVKANYIVKKRLVLNASLNHNYYTAFSSTGNQSFLLVNSYVGYKFLKDKALEARITAFDLLNQNKSITRTVAANYIENSETMVLKQYFILQLTYTIRKFKGIIPEETKQPFDGMMPGRGRHGGGGQ